ncbi:ABC transporter substrate-binding protein [Methylovorus mays]|uniref:ABC transporter substrate-binding protein n=1 Tax=Methylovorus mays TaxID=184077 RepID=UPI001E2A888E|nr:ABC transporter substrate-binding protein [Methylovorus mays]MCB5207087.1 ABC transporter substrate-binding protein [Methylovorus mays]
MSVTAIDSIWYTRCPVPTPLGLAARENWFAQEFAPDHITIKTLQEVTEADLRESHYDHRLPHSFRQGGSVPAIWARANGTDTRVIGLNWVDEAQLVVTLPDSGITSVAELKGKRIALPLNDISIDHQRASALRGIVVSLEAAGLSAEDIVFVDLPVPQGGAGVGWTSSHTPYATEFEALKAGKVDAIYVKGARGVAEAHKHGVTTLYDVRNHPDPIARANNSAPRPITVDNALLQERPDLVVRFLSKILDVADWAAAHEADTVSYIAKESHSTDEWVRKAYGNDIHLKQGTSLDDLSIAGLTAYKDFLFKWGYLKADFDVADWIAPGPLDELLRTRKQKAA